MTTNKVLNQLLEPILRTSTRKATVESVITGFVGQLILIISGILVARILGAEGRGYLALLMLFPVIVSQVGLCGIPQAITYYVAKHPNASKEIFRKVMPIMFMQCLGLTVLLGLVVIFFIVGKPKNVAQAGYTSIIVMSGMVIYQYGLALLQGKEKFRIFNILRLMPMAFYTLAVVLVFLSEQASIFPIVLIWSLSNLIAGIITLYLALNDISETASEDNKSINLSIRKVFAFGLRGMIGWAEPLETYRLDQLLCGLLLTPSALGFYVVAQAFTNLPRFLAQSIGFVAYPIISTGKSTAQSGIRIRKFVSITVIVNALIVLALAILMPILIPFFFGDAFRDSIIIAQILLFGALIASIRRILVESVRGLGRPEVSTYAALSLYPWLAIAAPWLTRVYGIEGLAFSVVLGQVISLTVAIILIRNIRGIAFND